MQKHPHGQTSGRDFYFRETEEKNARSRGAFREKENYFLDHSKDEYNIVDLFKKLHPLNSH